MPKQVDHQARREQIADAVCRLAGSQGLDAVSLRHVAAEAGVSMGMVQHYFTTKDEMLLFAFRTLSERFERRLGAAMAGVDGPRALLRALLVEMLPLGDEARTEAPVWIAFLARSVVEPRLAGEVRGREELARFVAGQIRAVRPDHPDPVREADLLLALVDGLMIHLVVGQLDAEGALATLDFHLDRVLATGS